MFVPKALYNTDALKGNFNACVSCQTTTKDTGISAQPFRMFLRTDEGQDQIKLLKEARKQNWEARYEALVAYKTKHGNCLVPKN